MWLLLGLFLWIIIGLVYSHYSGLSGTPDLTGDDLSTSDLFVVAPAGLLCFAILWALGAFNKDE
jgi:hypothetical protein